MNTDKLILQTLEDQVRETRRAYYANVPGVRYEDMAAAAKRLLTMRAAYERASGRRVTSEPTKEKIAILLRSL